MKKIIMLSFLALIACVLTCCSISPSTSVDTPTSSSGVEKATVTVATDADGHTTEQRNVMDRYKVDNTPGSIKHLYIISAYSGQVLVYSTVRGKVTSSGKRLTPTSVLDHQGQYVSDTYGFDVYIGGQRCRTTEVLQDDGTYGSSAEYIFWFDTKGAYHQQYITGGMIVHVSDQPLAVKNVILNMELSTNATN
jgi:pullulanase/glycogen debranching enzyme